MASEGCIGGGGVDDGRSTGGGVGGGGVDGGRGNGGFGNGRCGGGRRRRGGGGRRKPPSQIQLPRTKIAIDTSQTKISSFTVIGLRMGWPCLILFQLSPIFAILQVKFSRDLGEAVAFAREAYADLRPTELAVFGKTQ